MSLNNNLTINQQQPIAYEFINLAYILSIIELIIHPFIFLISFINLLILIQNNILHPNLRLLLIGQSFTIILFEITRFLLVLQKFISGYIFNPGFIILQVII
jgi:hypothetical protein